MGRSVLGLIITNVHLCACVSNAAMTVIVRMLIPRVEQKLQKNCAFEVILHLNKQTKIQL